MLQDFFSEEAECTVSDDLTFASIFSDNDDDLDLTSFLDDRNDSGLDANVRNELNIIIDGLARNHRGYDQEEPVAQQQSAGGRLRRNRGPPINFDDDGDAADIEEEGRWPQQRVTREEEEARLGLGTRDHNHIDAPSGGGDRRVRRRIDLGAASPPRPNRVTSAKLHITFSGCSAAEITKAIILAKLREVARTHHFRGRELLLEEWQIAWEDHENPADPIYSCHAHVYVCYSSRIDIRDYRHCTLFDLPGENGRAVRHPEIQGVGKFPKDRTNVLNYGRKYGDYQCELKYPIDYTAKTRPASQFIYHEARHANSVEEALDMIAEHNPQDMFMRGEQIAKNCRLAMKHAPELPPPHYKLADFLMKPLPIWKPLNPKEPPEMHTYPTFYLHGKTKLGKTQFAMAHGKRPLLVTNIEQLVNFHTLNPDLIVLDDANIRSLDFDVVFTLIRREIDRSFKVRYWNVHLPKHLPIIITSNLGLRDKYPLGFPPVPQPDTHNCRRDAVLRRIFTVKVKQSLFRPLANTPQFRPQSSVYELVPRTDLD